MALALPIDLEHGMGDLEAQDVFAFLPLTSYGFKFVLQADWIVPAARESIDASSAWNKWLLEQLPTMFVALTELVVSKCQHIVSPTDLTRTGDFGSTNGSQNYTGNSQEQSDESGTGAASNLAVDNASEPSTEEEEETKVLDNLSREAGWHLIRTLVAAVPVPSAITGIFRSKVPPLLAQLKEVEFIPTMSGCFKRPSDVVLLPRAFEQNTTWISISEQLLLATGQSFVCEELRLTAEAAKALGIKAKSDLLLSLLKAASEAWKEAVLSLEQVAWLASTLCALRDETPGSRLAHLPEKLRSLRVFPLQNGTTAAISGRSIYELTGDVKIDDDLLQVVRALHADFVNLVVRQGNQSLFGILGIKKLNQSSLVNEVLPSALTSIDATEAIAVKALVALALQCKAAADAVKALGDKVNSINVLTNEGLTIIAEARHLHLPDEYGKLDSFTLVSNKLDVWKGAQVLSPQYLSGLDTEQQKRVLALLQHLGVDSIPSFHTREHVFESLALLNNTCGLELIEDQMKAPYKASFAVNGALAAFVAALSPEHYTAFILKLQQVYLTRPEVFELKVDRVKGILRAPAPWLRQLQSALKLPAKNAEEPKHLPELYTVQFGVIYGGLLPTFADKALADLPHDFQVALGLQDQFDTVANAAAELRRINSLKSMKLSLNSGLKLLDSLQSQFPNEGSRLSDVPCVFLPDQVPPASEKSKALKGTLVEPRKIAIKDDSRLFDPIITEHGSKKEHAQAFRTFQANMPDRPVRVFEQFYNKQPSLEAWLGLAKAPTCMQYLRYLRMLASAESVAQEWVMYVALRILVALSWPYRDQRKLDEEHEDDPSRPLQLTSTSFELGEVPDEYMDALEAVPEGGNRRLKQCGKLIELYARDHAVLFGYCNSDWQWCKLGDIAATMPITRESFGINPSSVVSLEQLSMYKDAVFFAVSPLVDGKYQNTNVRDHAEVLQEMNRQVLKIASFPDPRDIQIEQDPVWTGTLRELLASKEHQFKSLGLLRNVMIILQACLMMTGDDSLSTQVRDVLLTCKTACCEGQLQAHQILIGKDDKVFKGPDAKRATVALATHPQTCLYLDSTSHNLGSRELQDALQHLLQALGSVCTNALAEAFRISVNGIDHDGTIKHYISEYESEELLARLPSAEECWVHLPEALFASDAPAAAESNSVNTSVPISMLFEMQVEENEAETRAARRAKLAQIEEDAERNDGSAGIMVMERARQAETDRRARKLNKLATGAAADVNPRPIHLPKQSGGNKDMEVMASEPGEHFRLTSVELMQIGEQDGVAMESLVKEWQSKAPSERQRLRGQVGEHLAYLWLQQQHPDGHVKWFNQSEDGYQEAGLPYDITRQEQDTVIYVEVKTTDGSKDHVVLSMNEIAFAIAQGVNYQVLIITLKPRATKPEIRLIKHLIDQKQLLLPLPWDAE
eukprot:TRINITY_DN11465_c0_g2_i6.p1 TRINITY_DN11465_c0_g2~~TRINITY_DN11465_c0_g2_i6.p1  ORF type:complete len:1562 (+),score=387.99 TRINITY_DN11465_c0_g2_i6:413-4687(+)